MHHMTSKKIEFSKIMVALVMCTYFVGVGTGTVVVLTQAPEQIQWYFSFIAAPTALAIGFYTWKAKAENVIKISEGYAAQKYEYEHEQQSGSGKF